MLTDALGIRTDLEPEHDNAAVKLKGRGKHYKAVWGKKIIMPKHGNTYLVL